MAVSYISPRADKVFEFKIRQCRNGYGCSNKCSQDDLELPRKIWKHCYPPWYFPSDERKFSVTLQECLYLTYLMKTAYVLTIFRHKPLTCFGQGLKKFTIIL